MSATPVARGASALGRVAGVLLLLVVPAGLLFGALGSAAARSALAEGGVPCLFRLLTGIPCPFCGLTHATLSLGAGDLAAALAAHPLSPVLLALTLWGAWQIVLGRIPTVRGRPLRASLLVGCFGLLWVFNIVYQGLRA
jgi:hypothetical protein